MWAVAPFDALEEKVQKKNFRIFFWMKNSLVWCVNVRTHLRMILRRQLSNLTSSSTSRRNSDRNRDGRYVAILAFQRLLLGYIYNYINGSTEDYGWCLHQSEETYRFDFESGWRFQNKYTKVDIWNCSIGQTYTWRTIRYELVLSCWMRKRSCLTNHPNVEVRKIGDRFDLLWIVRWKYTGTYFLFH